MENLEPKKPREERIRFEMRIRKSVWIKVMAIATEQNRTCANYVERVLEQHYEYLMKKGWTKVHLPKEEVPLPSSETISFTPITSTAYTGSKETAIKRDEVSQFGQSNGGGASSHELFESYMERKRDEYITPEQIKELISEVKNDTRLNAFQKKKLLS